MPSSIDPSFFSNPHAGEELSTECLGINTTANKIVAFAISSFFAGMVGGLMAIYTFFITPEAVFSVEITLQTILILILGRGGTVFGPVFSAFFITFVSELLWSKFIFLHTGILGIVLVLVILPECNEGLHPLQGP